MFEAYLHDEATVFRLELVGHLSASEVPEVEAWWTTASSVERPCLMLDLRQLTGLDDAGKAWVEEKHRSGVLLRGGTAFAESVVQDVTGLCQLEVRPRRPGGLQRLLRLVS